MKKQPSQDNHSTSITNFIPLEKIGEGSFSSVYKVRRISDDQIYALKKIKIAALKEKERQNALNQIRILASLDSPYIAQYREAFFDEKLNLLCIVMEWANEGDLQKKIQAIRNTGVHIPEREVWKAACHSIQALLILHRNSILHRDIKSANVFISDGVYKLGDMNVSKVQDSSTKLAYTQTGTPYYASPQVWRDEPYDYKSDLWSLGCVIYEMCSGRPPFKGKDLETLYRNVQRGIYDRIPLQYSKQLSDLIAYCLRKDPKSRLTCQQLLSLDSMKRKCEEYEITIECEQLNEQLLKTIKLPLDLKDLKKKLPKSNYSCSQESREYKKTLLKLNINNSQDRLYSKKVSNCINDHKLRRITSEHSIDRNPEEDLKMINKKRQNNYKSQTREISPSRSDRSKKAKQQDAQLKRILNYDSYKAGRKLSQDSPNSGREILKQINVLKKLSQPAERCLSQRYLEDSSGMFLKGKDSSTDRLSKKRSLHKNHEEQLAELQRKVDLKRKQLRKIGSIQRLGGIKASQQFSYRQPLLLHSKVKQSASHISKILKSPTSTEDEPIIYKREKASHKRHNPIPQVQIHKVSSTPYMCGLSDIPRIKRIMERAPEGRRQSKGKNLSSQHLPYRDFQ